MGSIAKNCTAFFAILGIIFIPFPFNITQLQLQFTDMIFGRLIGFTAQHVFSKTLLHTKVYSDSVSMYILLLILFIIAVCISVALSFVKQWPLYRKKIFRIFYQFVMYYLVLQLLKYGADKIFKNQFYTPEPNTLFTPMGNMEKDLLYWSAMGTSYSYNIFLGGLEILAAVLIIVKRTRLTGLLLSMGILVNIVAINFSFDITVKLFSSFLLFLNCWLLYPYAKPLYQLLLQKKYITATEPYRQKTFLVLLLQWLAVWLILLEVFFPFMVSGKFNGDTSPKPYLHGAYEVQKIITGHDTLAAVYSPVKRFFVHKDNYLISQDQQDAMTDYKMACDKNRLQFVITDYQLHQTVLAFTYQPADSILSLAYFYSGKPITLIGKAINWQALPILRKGFHWTADELQ
jgi:hypothetical protein